MVYEGDMSVWRRDTPLHLSDFVARPKVFEIIAQHAPYGTMLDAGCGEGYGGRAVASHTRRVIGVDLSLDMLRESSGILSAQGDLRALPIGDGACDGYMSNFAFNRVPPDELPNAYAEAARVLSQNGLFVISIPHPRHLGSFFCQALQYNKEEAASFDYERSRGAVLHARLGTITGETLHTVHVHSRCEDHEKAMHNAGLRLEQAFGPRVTRDIAEAHPVFAEMEGKLPYLIYSGRKG